MLHNRAKLLSVMVGAVKSKQKSGEDRGKCRDSTHLSTN